MNDFGNNIARVITFNILVFFINRLCEKMFTTFSTSFYNLLFFMSLCEKGTFSMTFRLTLRFLLREDNAVKRID